jgi:phosphatidylglycerol:prolipoprotein diacylglycerol transferase
MPIHALTDYLAIFVGFELYQYFNKNPRLKGKELAVYILGALIGALAGSRLLALINEPNLLSHLSFNIIFQNKTIIGAIIGGILGIEISKKILGIKEKTGDSTVIPLMIAIIIGRIGCQLTGVADGTIGVPCSLLWCFKQGDMLSRHPLPLYEILYLCSLLPFAYYAYKNKIFESGVLFRIFVVLYLGLRFFLEFLKDEPRIFLSLTVIQIFCLAACIFYVYTLRGQLYQVTKKTL